MKPHRYGATRVPGGSDMPEYVGDKADYSMAGGVKRKSKNKRKVVDIAAKAAGW